MHLQPWMNYVARDADGTYRMTEETPEWAIAPCLEGIDELIQAEARMQSDSTTLSSEDDGMIAFFATPPSERWIT